MKFGVIIFPGSNCDNDLINVLQKVSGGTVEQLWHKDTDLKGCTHIFVPGGFSYGDYLRSGAIAKLSPVMDSVSTHAANGGFVMGICNGFQILCESGLLPGALLRNEKQKFICKNVHLKCENTNTSISSKLTDKPCYQIPIAHAEGRYYADEATIATLNANGQIIFRYADENGMVNADSNPNGSTDNIAGIANEGFNVFGMMPHPERAASDVLRNTDGLAFFTALLEKELA
ncbi:MAG: phosphoribosylformylglycinamidine synthase I [Bacteroidetes bacterium]|nr:MAG: phosphoribosylformylglycinamidine synthase I [Bacteroidota bacterium]